MYISAHLSVQLVPHRKVPFSTSSVKSHTSMNMYVCIYVCMHICMYIYVCICMYVCTYTYIYVHIYICIYTYRYICLSEHLLRNHTDPWAESRPTNRRATSRRFDASCHTDQMYICLYVCNFACVYVCLSSCMHICMYKKGCMCVCLYVCL